MQPLSATEAAKCASSRGLTAAGGRIKPTGRTGRRRRGESSATTNFQRTARVSADGQTLLFRSQRRLSDYASEGTSEFYLYGADTGTIGCVTCNPTGEPPTGVPSLGAMTTPAVIPTPPASTLSHNLSADGKRVFFQTTDALVGADTNAKGGCRPAGSREQEFPACTDVYEWEAAGAGSCEAKLRGRRWRLHLFDLDRQRHGTAAAGGCISRRQKHLLLHPLTIRRSRRRRPVKTSMTRGWKEAWRRRTRHPAILPAASKPVTAPRATARRSKPPSQFSGPGNPKPKKQGCPKGKHKVKGRCVKKKHQAKGKAHSKGRAAR